MEGQKGAMLEERSWLVLRTTPRSTDQEPNLTFMLCRAGVDNGKRPFELDVEEEHEGVRKASKVFDDDEENLSRVEFDRLSLTLAIPTDQADNQSHSGDHSSLDSLIHPLGRDLTINCLLFCSRADYWSVACLNNSFHKLIKSGEMYKLRRMNNVIEHWVYFSYSFFEWVALDPVSRRWMHLPKMNCSECFMCTDKESLAVGTDLLVFGKDIMSHVIYKYSILTNSWSSGKTMNFPRCLFGSASLGEIAILAGGCDSEGNVVSTAELYNSESETWETLPNMNKPRKMSSGVFMDGKFYVIGGISHHASKEALSCGEEFDLKTRTWKLIPNMSPRHSASSNHNGPLSPGSEAPPLVGVVNNQLYVADYANMEVKKYDKETRVWSTVGRLPEHAGSMNGWGLAFRACGDRLIVIGGPRGSHEIFIEVNSWKPDEGPPGWCLLARKHASSFVYNCAVMGC